MESLDHKGSNFHQGASRRAQAKLHELQSQQANAFELGQRTAQQSRVLIRRAESNALAGRGWLWSVENTSQIIEKVSECTALTSQRIVGSSVAGSLDSSVSVGSSHTAPFLPISGRSMGTELPLELLLHSL